ncbi:MULTISPECIES: hypothetical protein [unclassified Novosphingobium]|uniref:hypothetical protein n=1 Tax=unclassified Novosphingobium TaxID=2644732 RepID=UPI00146B51D1|nr:MULTISPECIES: hypothetical protein [unclassified Novosphingobium]NMN03869.1 hypothetical protein [Novosphingobium sp. SG919]NMN86141.1 hypothetical protein [Novosphingobium sp. SG916]
MARGSDSFAQPSPAIDYRRLAALLTGLGISPERLEEAVERALLEGDAQGLARLSAAEKRLVYFALGEGIASLRRDQDAALRAVGLTMSTFRNEAHLYRHAFLAAYRRTSWLLAAVAILALAGLLLQWAGKGEGEVGFSRACLSSEVGRLSVGAGRAEVPSLALGFGELAERAALPARLGRGLAVASRTRARSDGLGRRHVRRGDLPGVGARRA